MDRRPLTRDDLIVACQLADLASLNGVVKTACGVRGYEQSTWECGTACCIHGFAHISAIGRHTDGGPMHLDYQDLEPSVRDGVLSVLSSSNGTTDLIRRVLTRQVTIGSGAYIGRNVHIGNNVMLRKNVWLEDNVSIGAHTHIGEGTDIESDTLIGEGCVLDGYLKVPSGTIMHSRSRIVLDPSAPPYRKVWVPKNTVVESRSTLTVK
jgi:carbonic anhydrase/acetyltransferase-like protein (isoleucine patch superfamily)